MRLQQISDGCLLNFYWRIKKEKERKLRAKHYKHFWPTKPKCCWVPRSPSQVELGFPPPTPCLHAGRQIWTFFWFFFFFLITLLIKTSAKCDCSFVGYRSQHKKERTIILKGRTFGLFKIFRGSPGRMDELTDLGNPAPKALLIAMTFRWCFSVCFFQLKLSTLCK